MTYIQIKIWGKLLSTESIKYTITFGSAAIYELNMPGQITELNLLHYINIQMNKPSIVLYPGI